MSCSPRALIFVTTLLTLLCGCSGRPSVRVPSPESRACKRSAECAVVSMATDPCDCRCSVEAVRYADWPSAGSGEGCGHACGACDAPPGALCHEAVCQACPAVMARVLDNAGAGCAKLGLCVDADRGALMFGDVEALECLQQSTERCGPDAIDCTVSAAMAPTLCDFSSGGRRGFALDQVSCAEVAEATPAPQLPALRRSRSELLARLWLLTPPGAHDDIINALLNDPPPTLNLPGDEPADSAPTFDAPPTFEALAAWGEPDEEVVAWLPVTAMGCQRLTWRWSGGAWHAKLRWGREQLQDEVSWRSISFSAGDTLRWHSPGREIETAAGDQVSATGDFSDLALLVSVDARSLRYGGQYEAAFLKPSITTRIVRCQDGERTLEDLEIQSEWKPVRMIGGFVAAQGPNVRVTTTSELPCDQVLSEDASARTLLIERLNRRTRRPSRVVPSARGVALFKNERDCTQHLDQGGERASRGWE